MTNWRDEYYEHLMEADKPGFTPEKPATPTTTTPTNKKNPHEILRMLAEEYEGVYARLLVKDKITKEYLYGFSKINKTILTIENKDILSSLVAPTNIDFKDQLKKMFRNKAGELPPAYNEYATELSNFELHGFKNLKDQNAIDSACKMINSMSTEWNKLQGTIKAGKKSKYHGSATIDMLDNVLGNAASQKVSWADSGR